MKKVILVFLILVSTTVWAEKPKPNPSDFAVNIHVQSSRLKVECGDVTSGTSVCYWYQYLSAMVDGKKVELRGNMMVRNEYLLKLGDYKAKILKEEDTRVYGYQRTYQMLFPDGAVAEYLVVGESE
jgi:hypothetical protein